MPQLDTADLSVPLDGPFGPMPAEQLIGRLIATDPLVHTWDLALRRRRGRVVAHRHRGRRVPGSSRWMRCSGDPVCSDRRWRSRQGSDVQTEFLGFVGRRARPACRRRSSWARATVGQAVVVTSEGDGVSELFDPTAWRQVEGFEFTDITYHRAIEHGTVRVAFDRPEVRNAFRPHTVDELFAALEHARQLIDVGCGAADRQRAVAEGWRMGVLQRRRPTDPRSGRLQVRGRNDRRDHRPRSLRSVAHPRGTAAHPLHAEGRDLRRAGMGRRWWAQPPRRRRLDAGEPRHARFKQTDADVASFDGGFGSAYLARQVGQKFAWEIFFLGREYSADDAHRMGMVNAVVEHAELERTALDGPARQRQEPHGTADAQVLVQPHRRRTRRPAIVRWGSNASRLHDGRGR